MAELTGLKGWIESHGWESSGFFIGIIALFGSLWGLSETDATSIVTAVTGLITAGALIWTKLKTSKFSGFGDWIKNSNTWVYIAATVGQFLPNAGELVASLRGVVDAVISKNFGAILSALVAAAVMAWNIFFKKNTAK